MTVLLTVAALQTKHLTISGVTSAPTAMPASLNSVALPCVLVFPGEAEWTQVSIGTRYKPRKYIIRLFVKPVAQGQGIDEGYQLTLPFFDSFATAYLNDLTLTGAVGHLDNIKDGGAAVLTFAGTEYHGIEFTMDVHEKIA